MCELLRSVQILDPNSKTSSQRLKWPWVRVPKASPRGRDLPVGSQDSAQSRALGYNLLQQRDIKQNQQRERARGNQEQVPRVLSQGVTQDKLNSRSINPCQTVETQHLEFTGTWSRRRLCLGWTRIPDSQREAGVSINDNTGANTLDTASPLVSCGTAGTLWKSKASDASQGPASSRRREHSFCPHRLPDQSVFQSPSYLQAKPTCQVGRGDTEARPTSGQHEQLRLPRTSSDQPGTLSTSLFHAVGDKKARPYFKLCRLVFYNS